MTWLDVAALAPILILALGAVTLLMVGAWWPARRPLLAAGIVLALAAAFTAGAQTPPVEEISNFFSTGPYARFFTILWSLTAALTLMFSGRYGEERGFSAPEYTALVLFAATGMSLLSAASSLVGLFLGLEAFTLVLYILIAFHKGSDAGAEAGLKYLILGAVATGFLAFGIALIYTASGTFHLPEAMADMTNEHGLRAVGMLGWGMLIVALGFKVSLVPFHLWTPDVYQGAPAPVAGILSTGSKGAVFAALLTLFASLGDGRGALEPVLWTLSALSMVIGTLCALRQENVKRMLAYSSVVHMGYVLMAVLAGGAAGHSAVVFYLVAYAAVNLGAFGVIATLSGAGGEPQLYADYRGAGYCYPMACGAMAVFLFSLAGIPPTAGFIGKFGIFYAAVEADYIVLVLLGVLSSLISIYYYLRVVVAMFMTDEQPIKMNLGSASERAAVIVCLIATLLLGILPGPLLDLIASLGF